MSSIQLLGHPSAQTLLIVPLNIEATFVNMQELSEIAIHVSKAIS